MNIRGLACLWAVWLGLTRIAIAAVALVSVTVPPEKAVSGDRLLLGEVAFIEVLDPAGRDLASALAQADLGPAPGPGRSAVLRRDEIKKMLLASGLDIRSATWNLPPELKVTAGESASVSEAELRAALEKHLAASEPYQSGRFEVVSLNISPPPALSQDPVTVRFQPQISSNPVNVAGYFIFTQKGRDAGRARVTALVDLSLPALVAARALPRGRTLTAEDVSLTFLPYNQAKGALSDPDQALGATLKTTLAAGTPLRERSLSPSFMVRSGDTVVLIARQGNLSATTTGEAKADGALGDTIAVINLSSKKSVRGRVVGPGQVEVIF
ncbi:MAG: flagellar basal body P-ring formation chaperone FlgA [Candidatus Adiutrix sp.]|jgi:flagella basal body P-ring formation protein FlgA|nr:flagellar basal body P-ring formation chaperone FlgA [Candidatus Adiutrix sp.]